MPADEQQKWTSPHGHAIASDVTDKQFTKPASTLIARHIIDGEELVCVAPWYWDEIQILSQAITNQEPVNKMLLDAAKRVVNSASECEIDDCLCMGIEMDEYHDLEQAITAAESAPVDFVDGLEDTLNKWDNQGEINHEELCLFIEAARLQLERQKGGE